MRNLTKIEEPVVLKDNKVQWTTEYLADKSDANKKYKYRHPDIKQALLDETGFKCIYCESKLGHNTPGDIEHKIPSSKVSALHFEWKNISTACTICNNFKNDFYNANDGFIDPYSDDVEDILVHRGPVVSWKPGSAKAEIAIKLLKLNAEKRIQLILRKIQVIEDVQNLKTRIHNEIDPILKSILKRQLSEMAEKGQEFSGMVKSILDQ